MSRDAFIRAISSLDARTDRNIPNYFVLTAAIQAVREAAASGFAVIGLKGTGKTTLFRCLVEGWDDSAAPMTIGLSTDVAAFESYFEKINCLQFERSVRTGMMLFILKIIDNNTSQLQEWDSLSDWTRRKEILLGPKSRLKNIFKHFDGLTIMGVGLSWKDEPDRAFRPITENEYKQLESLLSEWSSVGIPLRIVIDDPDRLFTKGTNFDPHLLAGYILGTNWIATRFPNIQFVHVLKSSVYDSLWEVEEMANLPIDYFHYIYWSANELKRILDERLRFAGIDASDIFDDPATYSLPSILARVRNGPRDLLRYVEIILKSSDGAKVSESSIRQMEGLFKREARRQMESVYNNVYEGIQSFTETILPDATPISVKEFIDRFNINRLESIPAGLDYAATWLKHSERALQTLRDAGVIDVQIDGQWRRPFEAEYYQFDSRKRDAMLRKNAVFI